MFNTKKYEIKKVVNSEKGNKSTTYKISEVTRNIFGKIIDTWDRLSKFTELKIDISGYNTYIWNPITDISIALKLRSNLIKPLHKYKGFRIFIAFIKKEDSYSPMYFTSSSPYSISRYKSIKAFYEIDKLHNYIDENLNFVESEEYLPL